MLEQCKMNYVDALRHAFPNISFDETKFIDLESMPRLLFIIFFCLY